MPWHHCSEELRENLHRVWGSKPSQFQRLRKSLPRPHPDPQLEWHLRIYDQCTKLKRRLDRRKNTPLLSDKDLQRLNIIRGAPFDIDDCHPFDVEKRFFTATRDKWASQYAKEFLENGGKWPELERRSPFHKDWGGNLTPDIYYMNNYAPALWKMTAREEGYDSNTWWVQRGYVHMSIYMLC